MLISFSLENYLSFNEKTTFSFESRQIQKKSDHIYINEKINAKLLKFSAIYGKNGSGKTNLLKAIKFAQKIITEEFQISSQSTDWCQCENKNKNKPSAFELKFILNDSIYLYSIHLLLSKGIIIKENLTKLDNNKEITLYSFEDNKINFSEKLNSQELQLISKNYDSQHCSLLCYLNKYLKSILNNKENSILKEIYNWIKNSLEVIFPNQPTNQTLLSNVDKHFYLEEFARLLNDFDTGIQEIETENVSKEKVYALLKPFVREKIDYFTKDAINKFAVNQKNKVTFCTVIRSRQDIFIIYQEENGEISYKRLLFVHEINKHKIPFTMAQESDGIYRLFQLLEILLSNNPKTYIIDEINRSLHPKLTAQFIKKYFEYAKNKNIQLLTTTHETNIMDLELLRQDEIWITDFNQDNSTKLFNLAELKVRTDKKLNKNYMNNAWGGIPEFKEDFDLMKFLTE